MPRFLLKVISLMSKNTANVITLANAEKAHDTRAKKKQCRWPGQGDHVVAAFNLFFNLKGLFRRRKGYWEGR